MVKVTPLIAAGRFSARDYRDAKRAWSERLLLAGGPAGVLEGAARRAGAHAAARATATRTVPARRNPNVVGVGIAEKLVQGKPTGLLAVKFFVKTKFSAGAVSRGLTLPKEIDGLPVDVEETGTFRALAKRRARAAQATLPNPRIRMRPALPGCSIGFRVPGDRFVMAGTFGALVRTSRRVYILSNNHVLADENRLPLNSPIYQPGLLDGGQIADDRIAGLSRFIKLRANRYNRIDAALAEPLARTLVGKDVLHIGAPAGTAAAAIDMMVHKFGRTTSYTAGRVTSVDTDVVVEYETAELTFENQIVVQGSNGRMFSDSGDSGSIILQRGTNLAVGLLFAGSPTHTIANQIADVLGSLRVRMA